MTANPDGPRVESTTLRSRVLAIVGEALAVSSDRLVLHASLIDDLGAESIDFIDIMFRLEQDFNIQIAEEALWNGAFEKTDQASIDASAARLRERMPEFPWDRLPTPLTKRDLPRLITVQTIVDYLEGRGVAGGAGS